jgi:phenylpropionate dioxygenase-like ring-hydroxylating dioxygenase large terminal subunit
VLKAEDNDLLTRIGPGSKMGGLLRHYWIPALLTEELPDADGRPVRLRLLGEDLLAFRDTDGEVGIVSEYCLHRGASLFYGKNKECGIRCVYHGWKYDRQGNCVDMPNEPPASRFKEKIHLRAYRVHERNGIIWAYMGSRTDMPDPPHFEWNLVPENQVTKTKRLTRANWAQVLEGGIDSSHGHFLHRGTVSEDTFLAIGDSHPVYEVMDTDYGAMLAARHDGRDPEKYFWRVYQFLLPFYTMVPFGGDSPIISHAFVPRDDVSTMVWSFTWHPTRPMRAADHEGGSSIAVHAEEFREPTDEPDSRWVPQGGRDNDYLMDWDRQRATPYSGIPGIPLQDSAMQESMGSIYDRRDEHLGMADAAILKVRRRWLALARADAEAEAYLELPGEASPERFLVRSCSFIIPRELSWTEQAQKYVDARLGVYDIPVIG